VMAHAQKPDFVFRRNGLVHLSWEGTSVQWTTGSRGVRISGSNAGYTVFRGSVKSTGFPLHSPVSPSLPLPCVIVRHHVSTGVYAAKQLCLFGILGGTECSIRSGFWCGMLFMDSVLGQGSGVACCSLIQWIIERIGLGITVLWTVGGVFCV
jgi:hypothetical protein